MKRRGIIKWINKNYVKRLKYIYMREENEEKK